MNQPDRRDSALSPALAAMVEHEAHRALSEAQRRADPALVADGWELRFLADGVRAKEAVELYRSVGFEVRAESVPREERDDECSTCIVSSVLDVKAIYVRRTKP